MNIDKTNKVIILPAQPKSECSIEYKIINLPTSNLTSTKPYLVDSDSIYELNTILGNNTAYQLPTSGDAVKSYIFEPEDPSIEGGLLQSSKTIITSPFNFTYLLISIFHTHQEKFRNTFKTIDDIRDSLESLGEYTWVYDVPERIYLLSLDSICESIIEGNQERFYKYSVNKAMDWVNGKVTALSNFIFEEKGNSIMRKIQLELNDPTSIEGHIDEEVLQNTVMCYAIDYVCFSYLCKGVREVLVENLKYDFTKMETYLAEIKKKQRDLQIVDANMNEVNQTTSNANKTNIKDHNQNRNRNQSKNTQQLKRKKPVQKVAVGKGALDGFFKKKT